MNMTVFQQVKSTVDIIDAAQNYGLMVNRRHKALCPYHNDTEPSLSFKNGRFKCFSCGAGGDVIDLVGRLSNTTPLETVRELNSAYRLGFDLEKPVDRIETLRWQQEQERKRAFEIWEKETFKAYSTYFRLLREWRITCAPKSPDDTPDPLFAESCTRMDYIEYILDSVFVNGGLPEKQWFYRECAGDARRVKERVEKEEARDAGRIAEGYQQVGVFYPLFTPAYGYTYRAV